MAVKNVTISKTSATQCTVDPGAARLTTADDIKWANNTGDRVIVFVPHDKILGRPLLRGHFHHKIDDGDSYLQKGPSGASPKGSFTYAIFCKVTGTFAVGSDPEIIVV